MKDRKCGNFFYICQKLRMISNIFSFCISHRFKLSSITEKNIEVIKHIALIENTIFLSLNMITLYTIPYTREIPIARLFLRLNCRYK